MKKEEKKDENTFQPKYLTRDEVRELLKKNMDVIVSNIKKEMTEKKITQEILATAIRSEQQHVSYILRHGKGITINVLGRIAEALNVKLIDLVTISELAK